MLLAQNWKELETVGLVRAGRPANQAARRAMPWPSSTFRNSKPARVLLPADLHSL